jgi:hypothetical protein
VRDFILLMHNDAVEKPAPELWPRYFSSLSVRGVFGGGSSIGSGEVFRKQETPDNPSDHLVGYIRVKSASLAEARELLAGNPVFECGGSVEIRELPRG